MGLETATYITQLNAANPVGALDPKAQGDEHLRLIKSVLQNSFPNIDAAVTATPAQLNIAGASGVAGFAAPTVNVGITAPVEGVATTALRSDVQLRLSQAIQPTWTQQHIWNGNGSGSNAAINITGATGAALGLRDTSAAADKKQFDIRVATGSVKIRGLKDDNSLLNGGVTVTINGANVETELFTGTSQVATNASGITLRGDVKTGNFLRATGWFGTPSSDLNGPGIEIGYTNGNAQVLGYTRTGAVFVPLTVQAISLDFIANGASRLNISSTGVITAPSMHNGAATGNASAPALASGTYTPTVTNVSNSNGLTAAGFKWMRVGNVLSVAGVVIVTPAAATKCVIEISVPVPSAFTSNSDVIGSATAQIVLSSNPDYAGSGFCVCNYGAGTVQIVFIPLTTDQRYMHIRFEYLVK